MRVPTKQQREATCISAKRLFTTWRRAAAVLGSAHPLIGGHSYEGVKAELSPGIFCRSRNMTLAILVDFTKNKDSRACAPT